MHNQGQTAGGRTFRERKDALPFHVAGFAEHRVPYMVCCQQEHFVLACDRNKRVVHRTELDATAITVERMYFLICCVASC